MWRNITAIKGFWSFNCVLFWFWKRCWITALALNVPSLRYALCSCCSAWLIGEITKGVVILKGLKNPLSMRKVIFSLFRISFNYIRINRFRLVVRNDSLACLQNFCILFLDCHSGANAPLRNDVKSRKTPTNSVIASVSKAIQYNNQHWTPIAKPKRRSELPFRHLKSRCWHGNANLLFK